MTAYYNEIDPYAAQWLRDLISAGHIAKGDVDDRSIADVKTSDLKGYTQCHFFAGVGVWSYALRQAGWPDDRPVWTGSCPCQPFSATGKGEGTDDARHLWPQWFRLIREHRPVAIFGEQVAAAIRHSWLDLVCADLEGLGYAVGAAVMGAHSVGAPHIRQRLYFVADCEAGRRSEIGAGLRAAGDMGDAERQGFQEQQRERGTPREARSGDSRETAVGTDTSTFDAQATARVSERKTRGQPGKFWSSADWLPCIDGKARPVEPGTFPLAHGATARVGRLRAYGNTICAPQAAEFIRAFI